MSRLVVGPFNRVEGDLEVKLDIDSGVVSNAWVVSPLYRGFERILEGKPALDAMVYAPRICGICSVSQSVAASRALADAFGQHVPVNGEIAVNLVHAVENVADHLTHFYLFFMPDFARPAYRDQPWYDDAAERFKALEGAAAQEVLPARAQFLHLMGILAGKWPHTLTIQPGGSTRSVNGAEIGRMSSILLGFRRFLESTLFGAPLERIAELDSVDALWALFDEETPANSDFRRFLEISRSLELDRLGPSQGRFLSYGAYAFQDGALFRRGVVVDGQLVGLNPEQIGEDVSHAWYHQGESGAHPFDGATRPDVDHEAGYTWCKAPRLDGRTMEVGALARQMVEGHPLVTGLVAGSGGNVHARVVARLLEVALVVIEMERWLQRIRPDEAFVEHGAQPKRGTGAGLTEAARGALGHWVQLKDGQIARYQIVAPTTWNFSPRDAGGAPGPLEHALAGAPVRKGETEPVAVQHIVRSFDPCLVCTVH